MKHFGHLIAGMMLAFSLAACSTDGLGTAWDIVTGQHSSVQITERQVYIARNAFNAVEQTATNYLVLCTKSPDNPVCDKKAQGQIVQAVRAGRRVRNELTAFIKAHPDGAGAQTLYEQMVAATRAVKDVLTQYRIGG